jgi:hypothetical protein
MPRTRPYTTLGIKRKRCVRCGKRAGATWQACADDRVFRPMCYQCDVELNYWVLRWMNLPNWREKFGRYVERMQREYGFTPDQTFTTGAAPWEREQEDEQHGKETDRGIRG